MQDALKTKLLAKAAGQIPAGFIFWNDATFLHEDGESLKAGITAGTTIYSITGTLYGFLFEEDKVTSAIVTSLMPDYDGSSIYISNIKDLKFSLANVANTDFPNVTNITFNLSGAPEVVYKFDQNKFISDILGKNKDDFKQIISQYPHVASANLSIQPIWRQSFPENARDISVIVNYPN
jgi:hypothetical protein